MDVFDPDGNQLADLTLSDKQSKVIEGGELVTVLFHTPQLLRHLLGERSSSFTLRKLNGKVTTPNIEAIKEYVALQAAIKIAREAN